MTTATLSFAVPGCVTLRCPALGLDERRDREVAPPFAAWAEQYGCVLGLPTEAVCLLDLGLRIAAWIDGDQRWLGRLLAHAPPPLVLALELASWLDPLAPEVLAVPWGLLAIADVAGAHHLALDPTVRLVAVRRIIPPAEPQPPRLDDVVRRAA